MMQRKQRPPPTRGRGQRKMIFLIKLRDGVWTEVFINPKSMLHGLHS